MLALGGDLAAGFFLQPFLIVRGQNLAGHLGGGVDHEPAQLAFQLAIVRSCSSALASRAFATICSAATIASCCLRSAITPALARASSIIFCASAFAFREDLLVALFRFRQLLLDLVRIQQAFGNSLPPLFEHAENRLIGEALQEERDDDEADYLGQERSRRRNRIVWPVSRADIDDSAGGGKEEYSS